MTEISENSLGKAGTREENSPKKEVEHQIYYQEKN